MICTCCRAGVRNIGVLVTDGYANINERTMIPEAEAARRQNIELFSVAVGENPNLADLNPVASDPDSEHVYQMRTLTDVDRTANQLLDYLCQWEAGDKHHLVWMYAELSFKG